MDAKYPTHMTALARLMRARLRRDECGHSVISGTRGRIHEDGDGFCVDLNCGTKRALFERLKLIKRIGIVKQLGDTEVVFHVEKARLNAQLARMLRQLLNVRKVRSDAIAQAEAA